MSVCSSGQHGDGHGRNKHPWNLVLIIRAREHPVICVFCFYWFNCTNSKLNLQNTADTGCTFPMSAWAWRHNDRDGVSNHRRLHRLLSWLFRRRSKKTWSKLRVTGLWKAPSASTLLQPRRRIQRELVGNLKWSAVACTISGLFHKESYIGKIEW